MPSRSGDPERLVETTSARFPKAAENEIVLIPGTGHTYQQMEQYTADRLLKLVSAWTCGDREEAPACRV